MFKILIAVVSRAVNVTRGKVARDSVAARYCQRGSVAEPVIMSGRFAT